MILKETITKQKITNWRFWTLSNIMLLIISGLQRWRLLTSDSNNKGCQWLVVSPQLLIQIQTEIKTTINNYNTMEVWLKMNLINWYQFTNLYPQILRMVLSTWHREIDQVSRLKWNNQLEFLKQITELLLRIQLYLQHKNLVEGHKY